MTVIMKIVTINNNNDGNKQFKLRADDLSAF